jgi:hypothetical protein
MPIRNRIIAHITLRAGELVPSYKDAEMMTWLFGQKRE